MSRDYPGTVAHYVLVAAVLAGATAFTLVGGTQFANVALAAQDDSNVSLEVQSETSVTVEPNLWNFSNMNLGDTNFSDTSDLQIHIRNDGSTNITDVETRLNTLNAEDDNPLGTGDAGQYAAGRFFWVKNASGQFYHAGSLSWNATEKPSGITDGDNNPKAWGFYRNATGDYLWSLSGNGSSTDKSWCNATANGAPEIYMNNNTDSGDNRDLSDSNTTTYTLNDASNSDWTLTHANKGPLQGHYIAAWHTCEKFYIFRFDNGNGLPGYQTDERYFYNGTIAAGEEYTGRVGAALPQGIPAGTTNQTTLTVVAQQDS